MDYLISLTILFTVVAFVYALIESGDILQALGASIAIFVSIAIFAGVFYIIPKIIIYDNLFT